MKNNSTTITILTLLFALFSCSSDNEERNTTITAKINGTTKTFVNAMVSEQVYEDYSDYIVLSNQSDDATKTLSISLGKETTGPSSIFFIQYKDGDQFYQASGNEITTYITESSTTKIKGTFSGVLTNENSTTITITNGVIDITL